MAARLAHVVLEVVAHDHGHWCNRCQLPSGIRAWVALHCAHAMHLQVRVWCDECDGRDVTVDGPPA